MVFTRKLYIWVNWRLRKQLRKSTKTESRIENWQAACKYLRIMDLYLDNSTSDCIIIHLGRFIDYN